MSRGCLSRTICSCMRLYPVGHALHQQQLWACKGGLLVREAGANQLGLRARTKRLRQPILARACSALRKRLIWASTSVKLRDMLLLLCHRTTWSAQERQSHLSKPAAHR